jgi:hypothetical protein
LDGSSSRAGPIASYIFRSKGFEKQEGSDGGFFLQLLEGHTAGVARLRVVMSEDEGRCRLVSGDFEGNLMIWDLGEMPPAEVSTTVLRAANKTG